jgi:polysaccharide pyruvyl transferase WcaK-like protein
VTGTATYVGWGGRGNTGDDAIFQAIAGALWPAEVRPFPVYTRELLQALATDSGRALRNAHLLLGGGTLVGRTVWRQTLRLKAFPLVRRRPAFMVGAGVEDPAFQGRHSFSKGGRELQRWPSILERFDRVTVRGPRSQELLAEVGVPADVTGDPALLLTVPTPAHAPGKVVGVTVGYGDDLWGHDHDRVDAAVAECLRSLLGEGWRVRLLCMNDADQPAHSAVARALGAAGAGVRVEMVDTPLAYLRAASECGVVIAERLHAMVLAAAAGTPFVALEYQPKCRDFTASVGWEPWTVRTDEMRADTVAQLVADLAVDDAARAALAASVDVLRARLGAEVDNIRLKLEAA